MTEPITTELRGVMSHTSMAGIPLVELGEYEFASRCDAIDAVHSNLERENAELERENAAIKASVAHAYASGYEYAEQDRDGWVELPKDADGVPIHIGDVVDVTPTDKFTGHMNVVVTSVIFKRSAALVTVDTADRPFTFWPNRIRHHHAPTIEDVLREMLDAWGELPSNATNEAIIAEYAAKLRLAGDAE